MSGFVSQLRYYYLLYEPTREARTRREKYGEREREGAAGAWRAAGGGQSRRGPRSLGPPAGKKGPRARWRGPWRQTGGRAPALARADSQGRTYRLRPSSPSAIGHESARCIPRVLISHREPPPKRSCVRFHRIILPFSPPFFPSFSFRFHSFLSPAPIRSFCQNEGRTKVFLVWAP